MHREEIAVLCKHTALSNEFLVEIGRITANFALLERELIELAHFLLGVPVKSARAITSELSFRALQSLAASLIKEKYPPATTPFKDILKSVGKCEERRNQIAHSLWGSGSRTTESEPLAVRTKYTAKQQKGLTLQREEMTVGDLFKIAAEISIAAYAIEGLHASICRGEYSDG